MRWKVKSGPEVSRTTLSIKTGVVRREKVWESILIRTWFLTLENFASLENQLSAKFCFLMCMGQLKSFLSFIWVLKCGHYGAESCNRTKHVWCCVWRREVNFWVFGMQSRLSHCWECYLANTVGGTVMTLEISSVLSGNLLSNCVDQVDTEVEVWIIDAEKAEGQKFRTLSCDVQRACSTSSFMDASFSRAVLRSAFKIWFNTHCSRKSPLLGCT